MLRVVVSWGEDGSEPREVLLPACPRVGEMVELMNESADPEAPGSVTYEVRSVLHVEGRVPPVVVLGEPGLIPMFGRDGLVEARAYFAQRSERAEDLLDLLRVHQRTAENTLRRSGAEGGNLLELVERVLDMLSEAVRSEREAHVALDGAGVPIGAPLVDRLRFMVEQRDCAETEGRAARDALNLTRARLDEGGARLVGEMVPDAVARLIVRQSVAERAVRATAVGDVRAALGKGADLLLEAKRVAARVAREYWRGTEVMYRDFEKRLGDEMREQFEAVKADWVRERVEQLASDALVDGPLGAPGRPPFSAEAAPSLIAAYPNVPFEEVYGPGPLTEAARAARQEATERYLRALDRNMEGEAVPVPCDAERRDEVSVGDTPTLLDDADVSAARTWLREAGAHRQLLRSPLLPYVLRRHVGQRTSRELAERVVRELRELELRVQGAC